nr:zinc-binding dehydrogenase [Salinispora tropica]
MRQAFPLAEATGAHRLIETGHGRGKIVLLVGSPS